VVEKRNVCESSEPAKRCEAIEPGAHGVIVVTIGQLLRSLGLRLLMGVNGGAARKHQMSFGLLRAGIAMSCVGLLSRPLELCLAAAIAIVLTACGGGGMGFDPHQCDDSAVPGVWDVSLEYGGGGTGTQRWTISRHYCMLNIVAVPSDEYSPPSGYDVGELTPGDPGFWASWINEVGECDYYVEMTATIAGNSLTGPIDWNRKAHGTGQCLPAQGRIMATAVRH
jgi:hypothetical protein